MINILILIKNILLDDVKQLIELVMKSCFSTNKKGYVDMKTLNIYRRELLTLEFRSNN